MLDSTVRCDGLALSLQCEATLTFGDDPKEVSKEHEMVCPVAVRHAIWLVFSLTELTGDAIVADELVSAVQKPSPTMQLSGDNAWMK